MKSVFEVFGVYAAMSETMRDRLEDAEYNRYDKNPEVANKALKYLTNTLKKHGLTLTEWDAMNDELN